MSPREALAQLKMRGVERSLRGGFFTDELASLDSGVSVQLWPHCSHSYVFEAAWLIIPARWRHAGQTTHWLTLERSLIAALYFFSP
jgi:hypothetical protein